MLRHAFLGALLCVVPVTAHAHGTTYRDANEATRHAPCLKLGADESLGPSYAKFEAFFTALYEHAGLCTTSIAMAPKRIEQLLVRGELDGDWFRPSDYATQFSDRLTALPQPVFGLEAHLIWLKRNSFSGKPEDLKGLTVGHQAGFRWLETHLPQMGARTMAVPSTTHTWNMLDRGRIDVFATSGVHKAALTAAWQDKTNNMNSALWTTVSFYHLLHPKHKDKVEQLNSALREMIITHHSAADLQIPGIQPAKLAD
ncbi:hypothetical protein [Kordiimonas sp.]|uniref:hypothetical protein n=1 Tax=Kordiimonas sp. TaxID=1970157 RepID=UPI003A95A226